MRILMIGFSPNKGGVESYITNLCGQLPKEYEVIYRLPHMELDGKVWDCPPNRHNYIRYWKFWTRFFKENHFDVLYYNTCDIVSIDMLRFAKAARIPVRIIHAHSTGNQVKRGLFHHITEKVNRKNLWRYATHLFACSKAAGNWMFGKQAFTLVKNGIDLKKYLFSDEARKRCRSKTNNAADFFVGYVGRLTQEKNPLFAVEIARQLCLLDSSVHVVFIGDGELRSQVADAIENEHLTERVHLLGARDDVNQWYSAFDCLMMPSLFEGLPFVLVEAQAAGLPCVVSAEVSLDANITGLVEYVPLRESAREWAQIILRACQKPRHDVSQKLIESGYSIEDTVKDVTDIIESAFEETR